MEQLHKRFTAEQVKLLLQRYCEGVLDRTTLEEVLGVGRTRFFALLKQYRLNPEGFSLAYKRETRTRLPAWVEEEIEHELMLEKNLIDDSTLPITTFNYSVIQDRLARRGIRVALSTIIDRARKLGCYQPHRRRKETHDREAVTTAIGALIQHDASHHR